MGWGLQAEEQRQNERDAKKNNSPMRSKRCPASSETAKFRTHPRVGEYEFENSRDIFALTNLSCYVCCTGPIPKELGALSKLEKLTLDENGLTGEKPKKGRFVFKVNPAHA